MKLQNLPIFLDKWQKITSCLKTPCGFLVAPNHSNSHIPFMTKGEFFICCLKQPSF